MTRIRSGWIKFRDLVPLLASGGLPLVAKGRLYSACVGSIMLYLSEVWSVKKEDLVKLERNDTRVVRWICDLGLRIRFLQSNLGLD